MTKGSLTAMRLLDAIGEVDDADLKTAHTAPRRRRNKAFLYTAVSLAVCFTLVLLLNIPNLIGYTSPENSSGPEIEPSVAEKMIAVYYVEQGVLHREEIYLPCIPEAIFTVWKERNGIGEEVQLLSYRLESNTDTTSSVTDTTSSVLEGEEAVRHKIGDCFVLHLTVSKQLKNYYDEKEEELLLESLRQTMMYSDIKYEECRITLE